jgi:hypothetical protein
MKRLGEMPRKRRLSSAIDRLPPEILGQLIEARVNHTHTVREMVVWLHDEEFDGAYGHVTDTMLYNWFNRRGYRAET